MFQYRLHSRKFFRP